MNRAAGLALLAFLVAAPDAAAQGLPHDSAEVHADGTPATSETLQPGRWSLGLEIPDGGGSRIGLWHMSGARTNLGLQVGVQWSDSEDSQDEGGSSSEFAGWSISVEPTLQRYLSTSEVVVPFLLFGVDFGIGQSRQRLLAPDRPRESLRTHYSLGARAGVGAEWFPLSRMSVGGHTGVRISYRSDDTEDTLLSDRSGHTGSLRTFVSGILLRLYF
ncbi:MAG: hypothetical protein RRA92_11455 [Gemmatimonadota bacterium]|nr:hypothetical protein [Gemmatimonadota bacterium]